MKHALAACLFFPVLVGLARADDKGGETVNINFPGVELEQVIQWASENTGKRFLYDERVMKHKVYFLSPGAFPKSKVMDVLHTVLKVNKLFLVRSGSPDAEIYEVLDSIDGTKQPIDTFGDGDREHLPADNRMITITVHLKHADPRSIQTTLQPLICDPKGIVVVDEVGAVVLTDYAGNVKRILKVLDDLDREPVGRHFTTVRLQHALAAKVAALLSSMTGAPSKEQGARSGSPPQVAADERTNQLVLYATEAQRVELTAVIATLDAPDADPEKGK